MADCYSCLIHSVGLEFMKCHSLKKNHSHPLSMQSLSKEKHVYRKIGITSRYRHLVVLKVIVYTELTEKKGPEVL